MSKSKNITQSELASKLVDNDIRGNREEYKIKIIDKNIDFRRVVNLEVFFKRHAIE